MRSWHASRQWLLAGAKDTAAERGGKPDVTSGPGWVTLAAEHAADPVRARDTEEPTVEITLGIEEELMIVDPETRDVIADPDPAIFARARGRAAPHRIVNEFLRSQIETNSTVCGSVAELAQSLHETRGAVIAAARAHGARVIASSTHPWARWEAQLVTAKPRYRRAAAALQDSVRQFFIGGMHIHAGFATADLRIQVMDALLEYLPLMLALSTSSPFHGGRLTGLKSHRQITIGAIPRTGLPPAMRSEAEYTRIVETYRGIGAIEDGSELRWDIRPSASYPTIELRICDICPRMEDAVAIAALYACLIRHIAQEIEAGKRRAGPPREIVEESRWLAQRYGTFAFLPERGHEEARTIPEIATALVSTLSSHARTLGCEKALRHAIRITEQGSSAERQEDTYREAMLDGANESEALRAVVDLIIAETECLSGTTDAQPHTLR